MRALLVLVLVLAVPPVALQGTSAPHANSALDENQQPNRTDVTETATTIPTDSETRNGFRISESALRNESDGFRTPPPFVDDTAESAPAQQVLRALGLAADDFRTTETGAPEDAESFVNDLEKTLDNMDDGFDLDNLLGDIFAFNSNSGSPSNTAAQPPANISTSSSSSNAGSTNDTLTLEEDEAFENIPEGAKVEEPVTNVPEVPKNATHVKDAHLEVVPLNPVGDVLVKNVPVTSEEEKLPIKDAEGRSFVTVTLAPTEHPVGLNLVPSTSNVGDNIADASRAIKSVLDSEVAAPRKLEKSESQVSTVPSDITPRHSSSSSNPKTRSAPTQENFTFVSKLSHGQTASQPPKDFNPGSEPRHSVPLHHNDHHFHQSFLASSYLTYDQPVHTSSYLTYDQPVLASSYQTYGQPKVSYDQAKVSYDQAKVSYDQAKVSHYDQAKVSHYDQPNFSFNQPSANAVIVSPIAAAGEVKDDSYFGGIKDFFKNLAKAGSDAKEKKKDLLKVLKITKAGLKKGAALLKAALFKGKLLAKAKAKLALFESKFKKDEEVEVKQKTFPTASLYFLPSQVLQVQPFQAVENVAPLEPLAPVFDNPSPVYGPPVAVIENPSPVYGPPAPVIENPSPVYGPPAALIENPSPVYGPPAAIIENPSPVYGPPAPFLNKPSPRYGAPVPHQTQFLQAHGGVSVGSDSQFPVPINHDLAHFQSSYLTYEQAPFAANDDHFHHASLTGVSHGSFNHHAIATSRDIASSYMTYDQPKLSYDQPKLSYDQPKLLAFDQPQPDPVLVGAPLAAVVDDTDKDYDTLSGFFDTLSKTGSLSKANKNLFLKTLKLTKKGIKKGAALLKAALFKGKLLAKAKTKLAKFGAKFKKDEADKESEIKTQALPTVALHFVPSQPVQILPVEHFVEKQVAPAPPVLKDPPLVYGPPPQTPRYTYGPPEDTKPLYVQQSSNKKDISGPVSTITGTLPSSAQTSVFSWLNPFSWFSGSPFDTDEEIYDYDHDDVHDRRFKRSVEHSHVESSSSHDDKASAAEELITHQQEVYRSRLAEGPMADADGEPIFGVFGGGPVDGFIPDGPPPPYGSNHWAHHAGPVDSVATNEWEDAELGNETSSEGLTPAEDRIYNLVQ